ncbi:hypothetical protein C7S18_21760 [Ahniella affigens]|uniref:CDP-diacylglycerol--glycerol-3-phosphate 3-phosphatidyltransferase n=1 Tax=Ahniella affigens TaxID=2021234 RepID=A0A2P1PXR6_9GAMM|nr:CDP-alcohol phosphatidyltransferase family protein [Ahniella affigens]AVP99639.1 hypothetical protein C7S18_21760 [Ahniella affigens]
MLRHLPNLLSGLRLISALPIALLISTQRFGLALVVLAIAGTSDLLDGFLAKRFEWQSALGAWLDPAADKLLSLSVLLSLWQAGAVPLWFLAVALGRDLLLALGTLAYVALVGQLKPEPSVLGRSAVFALLSYLAFVLVDLGLTPVADRSLLWMSWISASLALASSADYVLRFAERARQEWPRRRGKPGQ